MAINTKKGVEELISYSIVADKASVISILKRNGVKLSPNPSNAEVTTAVLIANKKSSVFRKDLAALLQKNLPKGGEKFMGIVGNSQDFGFTGVDDVTYMKGFTGIDDFSDFTGWDEFESATAEEKKMKAAAKAQATAARKASGKQTKVGAALTNLWNFTKTNVLTPENVNAGIQVGLNKVNQDSLARQNALEQQSQMLQQQQQQMQGQIGKGSGMTGTTMIYIGVGVIALVGIGFLIVRQSKK
jgi:hypothetical protein